MCVLLDGMLLFFRMFFIHHYYSDQRLVFISLTKIRWKNDEVEQFKTYPVYLKPFYYEVNLIPLGKYVVDPVNLCHYFPQYKSYRQHNNFINMNMQLILF